MGEKTITTQVKIDGEIVPDFSRDWEVEFQREKYIMPLRIPQGAKENTSLNSTIDLTFQHWAIYQLKRWPFVTIQQIAAGTYLPDEEVATVQLNLKDFCILFGQVLKYYYGDAITIDLNPAWQYKQEATIITISHTKIWNVLIDAFHSKYGVRWEIKAASDNSNAVKGGERYVIRVGYPTTEVDHIFEYGFEGGLLKVERQVQSEEIHNMLKGRGGETNIPFRYFKDTDPNNPDFRPDPDWVEELANIPFKNLMPATFRSYVQGWKAAHINQTDADGKKIYAGYTPVGEANAYAPWAYRKGYTDTKFHPVEFVADEITISPSTGDKQVEILPGYSPYVKKGSSLDKYGPLPDTLDNNDDIYPTLQGTGLDIAVDVEQIKSDDVAWSTESDAVVSNIGGVKATAVNVAKSTYATLTIRGVEFTVPEGKTANFEDDTKILSVTNPNFNGASATHGRQEDIATNAELTSKTVKIYNKTTGEVLSASGIPAGTYYYEIVAEVHNLTTDKTLNITVGTESPKLTSATIKNDKWRNTFDIWVKNIWNSSKLSTETDAQYAERVWKPVLGDREKNTAKVVFTSGALAVSEDYEFTIVDFPVPDASKTWEEKNDSGVVVATHTSYWRITLAKSDAELKATGLYVPSTKKQGKAGDTFVFIGTEMTHVPYVVDAEKRLDDWKKDQLGEVKEIKPTAVVTTDRVRLNNGGRPNALINQLRVGNSLRLFDKRFFNEEGKAYETLYLQSITYTYREPTSEDAALNPDVEIVLGNEYTTSANPVSMMQGEISALQRQVGSISNVEQIVRAVGDKLYLRKDGISDRSLSPTQFFSLLTSGDFRAGLVGGAGWGFFKDENGEWVLEVPRLNVRQNMSVNTLVINQAEGRGGMEVDTAAFMEVTRVVETETGYICYFDQKNGSVANLFHIGDVAYCNQWTPENTELKYYRRRVVGIGADNVSLTKTVAESDRPEDWPDSGVDGTGIPSVGDIIIHYGSYTDKERQYVKVRDVVGGGYERYIEGLDSVGATGTEYYFVGKQNGENRWFVGNKDFEPYSGKGDGSYLEYKNRKFSFNNVTASTTAMVDGVRKILAGMNGEYSTELGGRTIGSWWGGPMVDLFDADGNRRTDLAAGAYATSLVRLDGSFYFCNGNFGGRPNGSAWFGGENGMEIDESGHIIFGSGIQLNFDGSNQGLIDTLQNLANFNLGLSELLIPCDKNGTPLEGGWADALKPDGTTNADGTKGILAKSLLSKVGFWSMDFISCLGLNDDTGGGTGGNSYDLLESWNDYDATHARDALSAALGYDLLTRVIKLENSEPSESSEISVSVTGTGNAITAISNNGPTINAVKGESFALADHVHSSYVPFSVLDNYYSKSESDGRYLTGITRSMVESVLTGDVTSHYHSQYLLASAYTAQDVLSKLKTVDGHTSGLDADTLDGYHGADYLRSFWSYNPGYDCSTHNDSSFVSFTYRNNAPFLGSFVDISVDGYGFYLGTGVYGDHPLYYRRHGQSVDGGMGTWQQLARVTDNVASASKLTAGSKFIEWDAANGAWRVDGDLYATGSLTALGFEKLSATEAIVDSLTVGTYGHMSATASALEIWHNNDGDVVFGSNACFTAGFLLGEPGSSYGIDETGVAYLASVEAEQVKLRDATFTQSGSEIYVTIGSTRYKLTKTTA